MKKPRIHRGISVTRTLGLLVMVVLLCGSARGASPPADLRLAYGSQVFGEVDPCG